MRTRWIAVAEVRRLPGNKLLRNDAAFVSVVGEEANADAFAELVVEELGKLRFEVLGLEDVALLSETAMGSLSRELKDAITELGGGIDLVYGPFHSYPFASRSHRPPRRRQ
jgi:hypothetical protein